MLDMPGYEEYMWPDWQDHYTDAEVIVFLEIFSTDWIYQKPIKMCILGLSLRPIVPEFLRIGRQQSENLIFSPGDSYILKFGNRHLMLCRSLPIFTIMGRSDQFSSVAQSCPTLCDPMDCSTPDFPVHHQLIELAQTHVHQISDAVQPSHPQSSPSPPTFNLS